MNNSIWILSDQVLVWAVNVVLQVSIIAILASLAGLGLRRSPAARYWLLCSALLLVLLCPVFTAAVQSSGMSLVSVSMVREQPTVTQPPSSPIETPAIAQVSPVADPSSAVFSEADVFSGAEEPRASDLPVKIAASDERLQEFKSGSPTATSEITESPIVPATLVITEWGWILRTLGPPLLIVWVVGVLMLLCRLAVAWYRLSLLLRSAKRNADERFGETFREAWLTLGHRSVHRMPELVFSDKVSGPVEAGLRSPKVVLPKAFAGQIDAEQLRDILIHEVAHVARGDQLVVLLQNLMGVVFWIHPLVRLLNRELAQAREEVCDNYVLAATDAPSYSRTLLTLSQLLEAPRTMPGTVGLFTSRWKLEQRVAGLLDEQRSRVTRLSKAALTFIAAVTLALGVAASLGTISIADDSSNDDAVTVAADAQQPQTSKKAEVQKPPVAATDQEEHLLTVSGHVTDESGKPIAGAVVGAIGLKIVHGKSPTTDVLAEQLTDESGQYQLDIHGATSKTHSYSSVIALADGKAIAFERLNLDQDKAKSDLRLKPQELIKVKLIDIEGQPAANMPVQLNAVMVPPQDEVGLRDVVLKNRKNFAKLRTDENGLLTIESIAAGHGVMLKVSGNEQFAPQDMALNTGMPEERGERDATYRCLVKNMKPGEVGTLALAPARFFEGVVLLGDSGEPAAGAKVSVGSSQQTSGGSSMSVQGTTDDNGKFRISVYPGVRFRITARPPEGSSFQIRTLENLKWESGESSKSIEIKLAEGLVAHGIVVDAMANKPLQGAYVQYLPDRIHNQNITPGVVTGWQGIVQTEADGKFRISVFPGPGTLLIHAPDNGSYVLQTSTQRELEGRKGGQRMYAHAFQAIDPVAGETSESLTIGLTPGNTAVARVVDESGNPIEDPVVVSRLRIAPTSVRWRAFSGNVLMNRLDMPGLEEGKQYETYFLDPKRRLGATVQISTDDLNPTVRLIPCGSAKALLVDQNGEPIANNGDYGLDFVATPGPMRYDVSAMRRGEIVADEEFSANVDRLNHGDLKTNEKGEIVYPALIPGATYRFNGRIDGKWQIVKEFKAESGKTHDLGRIEIPVEEE